MPFMTSGLMVHCDNHFTNSSGGFPQVLLSSDEQSHFTLIVILHHFLCTQRKLTFASGCNHLLYPRLLRPVLSPLARRAATPVTRGATCRGGSERGDVRRLLRCAISGSALVYGSWRESLVFTNVDLSFLSQEQHKLINWRCSNGDKRSRASD